jgi:hypothetical protein
MGNYSVLPYVFYLMCSAAKQTSIYAVIYKSMHFCCTLSNISPQAVYIAGISNTVKQSAACLLLMYESIKQAIVEDFMFV